MKFGISEFNGDECIFVRDKVLQVILYFRRVMIFNDVLMMCLCRGIWLRKVNAFADDPTENDYWIWLCLMVDRNYGSLTQGQLLVEFGCVEVRMTNVLETDVD